MRCPVLFVWSGNGFVTSINVLSISCLLQILHSVKGCVKGLCYYALRDYTGKTHGLKVCCWCSTHWLYVGMYTSLSREISASPIRRSFRRWYLQSTVWLEMISSVTILLMILTVGMPFCMLLSVLLSDCSLLCTDTQHLSSWIQSTQSAVMWCWMCLLSLQKHCSTSECTEVLHPLLGLITNVSTITSTVIGVRHVMCDTYKEYTYLKERISG